MANASAKVTTYLLVEQQKSDDFAGEVATTTVATQCSSLLGLLFAIYRNCSSAY